MACGSWESGQGLPNSNQSPTTKKYRQDSFLNAIGCNEKKKIDS